MTRRYWNINLEEMMEARVHFGCGTRKWNPRMAFILQILRELHIFYQIKGKHFLIIGPKNKVADLVASTAIKAQCHFVNKKLLGGMLTTWSTIEMRLQKFRDLRVEQRMIKLISLPKRDATMLKEIIHPANISRWDQRYDKVS
ncbi:unnamed protein product [Spirodela intermedia]|uniref:Small ribosomal subunit protein uS2c n=1 Tax=Spirodela intermedia TaxID=51605 RepID=A0A7I8JC80_SPIIN|nr:unnamed protein product [Spirodela intermedia]CAA6667113.1 unnamed protein product [Spirodela intermedia]